MRFTGQIVMNVLLGFCANKRHLLDIYYLSNIRYYLGSSVAKVFLIIEAHCSTTESKCLNNLTFPMRETKNKQFALTTKEKLHFMQFLLRASWR